MFNVEVGCKQSITTLILEFPLACAGQGNTHSRRCRAQGLLWILGTKDLTRASWRGVRGRGRLSGRKSVKSGKGYPKGDLAAGMAAEYN